MSTFIANCLAGTAKPEEINDYITQWHGGDSQVEIHTFLGMTEWEYAAWLNDPSTLIDIISRSTRISVFHRKIGAFFKYDWPDVKILSNFRTGIKK